MRDRTAVVLGMIAGAVAGGVAGWLWLTDDGRRLRVRLEPALKDLATQALALRESASHFQTAARGGVRAVHDVDARAAARRSGDAPAG